MRPENLRSRKSRTAHTVTELVVTDPFVRIAQYGIGLSGFFELFFGRFIPGIAIRMILERELAVAFFDSFPVRGPGHTQHFIIITFCHKPQDIE